MTLIFMKGRKRNAQSPNRRPFVPAECREQAKKEWTSIKKYSIISPDEACQIVQTPQPRAAPNVSANPLGSNSKSHAPLRHAHPVGAELEESRSMTPKGLAARRTAASREALISHPVRSGACGHAPLRALTAALCHPTLPLHRLRAVPLPLTGEVWGCGPTQRSVS